jgi:anti-sigma factor RsiW
MSDEAVVNPAARALSCAECRELLSGYLDREVSEAERKAVEEHMRTCPHCAGESSCIQNLKQMVSHFGGVQPTSEFHQNVMTEMIRESQMVKSKPLVEAAARVQANSPTAARQELAGVGAVLLILILGLCSALLAYALVRWLT